MLSLAVPVPSLEKEEGKFFNYIGYLLVSIILSYSFSFVTCISIVIVSHSLYRATVSALFSLVVLLIMHFSIYMLYYCTIKKEEGRKMMSCYYANKQM